MQPTYTRVLTAQDFEGNHLRRARIDPRIHDPVWDGAGGEQPSHAPWIRANNQQMCWFTDTGDIFCVTAISDTATDACAIPLSETLVPQAGAALPTAFDLKRTHVFILLDTTGGTIDLTTWAPTMAGNSVNFQFRKIDSSPNKIQWTDPVTGSLQDFVDQQNEFIDLHWDGVTGTLTLA